MASEVEHLLKHLDENRWIQWERSDPLTPDFITVSVAGHQQHESQRRPDGRRRPEGPLEDDALLPSDTATVSYEPGRELTAEAAQQNPTAFASYSWDDDEHKTWVRELVHRLRTDGIDVKLDQWETAPGDQLTEFMERGVREHDFVIIVCTPKYKDRADTRAGGVGYEGDIMTAEVAQKGNHRKFIPILRSGSWEAAAASWLTGKSYIDLRSEPYDEDAYQDLLMTLRGERPTAPPVGRRPIRDAQHEQSNQRGSASLGRASTQEKEDKPGGIRIVEVIADEVTQPRNDGTVGSALYTVPLRLSAKPHPMWATLFVRNWDRPPTFTTMHRPGIARVVGDRVLLEGTTIEELEKYHRDTLQDVMEVTNEGYRRRAEEQQKRRRGQEDEQAQHRQNVDDVARRITFE
jgi:hypothetical protein